MILCDCFPNANAAEQEETARLPPFYAPLVSNEVEFYPVSEARNYSGQRLFIYFDGEEARVLEGSTKGESYGLGRADVDAALGEF